MWWALDTGGGSKVPWEVSPLQLRGHMVKMLISCYAGWFSSPLFEDEGVPKAASCPHLLRPDGAASARQTLQRKSKQPPKVRKTPSKGRTCFTPNCFRLCFFFLCVCIFVMC